jgi:hypothetical protein
VMPESAIKFGAYEASTIGSTKQETDIDLYRLQNARSPNSRATMIQQSYTRGPNSLLVVLLVSTRMQSLRRLVLSLIGMVAQFAVYPIDTLKL